MKATKKATKATTEVDTLDTFQGMSKLEPNEQEQVKAEAKLLTEAMKTEVVSKLAIGEHLYALRKILEPKRVFVGFLNEWSKAHSLPMSKATAYRYIDLYTTAHSKMPRPVLEMAIQRGAKLNAQTLAQNPPPQTTDKTKIAAYLDNLKNTRIEVVAGPDVLLKECVNFVATRWEKLPNNSKARTAFMRALIGMLLAKFGVASELSFSPMAVPDHFRAKRGRPLGRAA
jgi:hypothetical protein